MGLPALIVPTLRVGMPPATLRVEPNVGGGQAPSHILDP